MIRLVRKPIRKLLALLGGHVSPANTVVPLQPFTPVIIEFDQFTRGIDNIHIDVRLSPQFMSHTKRFVTSLIEYHVWRSRGGTQLPGLDEMKNSYIRMIEAVVHRSKRGGSLPLVILAQLAALKFILKQIQTELELARQALKKAIASATEHERQALSEHMVWLTRNRTRVSYTLCSQAVELIRKTEAGPVGDLRQSLHGERWPLPEHVLFNPLLLGDNPMDDELLMKHYVLLGQGPDGLYSFSAIGRSLLYLFWRRKPVTEAERALANATKDRTRLIAEQDRLRNKRARTRTGPQAAELDKQLTAVELQVGEASAALERAYSAYAKESYAWADVPGNVDVLFNVEQSREKIAQAKKANDRQGLDTWKAQMKFQRRLLRFAEQRLDDSGLLAPIIAAYEVPSVYKECAGALTAQQLHQFLANRADRRETRQQIKEKSFGSGSAVILELLSDAARHMDAISGQQARTHLVRFLRDFLTFRRDFRHYQLVKKAMEQIQVQEDSNNIRLSRVNNTLYEFVAAKEEGAVAQTVIGHVILKADVRGSTTITSELRKQGLNPASHFSLHFFAPINALLESYGAGKVFIEGDAVILCIMEYEEVPEQQLCVARACGLAKRLLNVVQANNAACRKGGLPELELGIGLVYSSEPPTYLYDGDTPITISPAIGKADRYSSCSWLLRKQRSQQGQRPAGVMNVDVYEIPEGDPLRGEKGEVQLRYNVNGIELDPTGFAKLQKEIRLEKIEVPGEPEPVTLHVGRFPDMQGTMHRLMVREGRIRFFSRQSEKGGGDTDQIFYEVVSNEQLINTASEMLKMEATTRNMPAFVLNPPSVLNPPRSA